MKRRRYIDVTMLPPTHGGLVVLLSCVTAAGKRIRIGMSLDDGNRLQKVFDEVGGGTPMRVEFPRGDVARITLVAAADIPAAAAKAHREDWIAKEAIEGMPTVTVTALGPDAPPPLEVLVISHAGGEFALPMSEADAARVKELLGGEDGIGKSLVLVDRKEGQVTLALAPSRH